MESYKGAKKLVIVKGVLQGETVGPILFLVFVIGKSHYSKRIIVVKSQERYVKFSMNW